MATSPELLQQNPQRVRQLDVVNPLCLATAGLAGGLAWPFVQRFAASTVWGQQRHEIELFQQLQNIHHQTGFEITGECVLDDGHGA